MATPESYSATVDSTGKAVVTIAPRNQLVTWVVSQVSASLPSAPIGSTCQLDHNGNFVTFLIPTGDVADGDPPIDVIPGDVLTVTWRQCTPGDLAKATAFYDVIT